MTKILVLAGSHEREIEYSYPVIDLLLEHYKSAVRPQEFKGIDGARKGLLWNISDKIAVAKVVKTGGLSLEYIKSLSSYERRKQFRTLIFSWHSPEYPYEPAHTFQGLPQWTSVHQSLIDASKADFYLDLHSNHVRTKGLGGTSLYINSNAEQKFHQLIEQALKLAQANQPETYGNGINEYPFSYANREKIKSELKKQGQHHSYNHIEARIKSDWGNNWYFRGDGKQAPQTKPEFTPFTIRNIERLLMDAYFIDNIDDIISAEMQEQLLSTDPAAIDADLMKQMRNSLAIADKYLSSNFAPQKTTVDYLIALDKRIENIPSYFLFEAISWGQEQQKATAQFVTQYLQPQL